MLDLKKLPFFLASTRSHSRAWPYRLSLSFQLRPMRAHHLPRIKYPRVLLGLFFLLLLIAMLFVYSNSAAHPAPYLSVPTTGQGTLATGQGLSAAGENAAGVAANPDSPHLIPVTAP